MPKSAFNCSDFFLRASDNGRTFYDYTCHKEIKDKDVKRHLEKGCVVEGTAQEFFDEIEKEAWNTGAIAE